MQNMEFYFNGKIIFLKFLTLCDGISGFVAAGLRPVVFCLNQDSQDFRISRIKTEEWLPFLIPLLRGGRVADGVES